MKTLTALRHAKSTWDDAGLDDFDRPLNDRGWNASRRVGRELEKRQFGFDLVIASPAARVRETIDGLQEEFEFDAPIQFEEAMYLAGQEQIFDIVLGLAPAVQRPLLVGHNPGLQQFLLALAGSEDHRLRECIASKFPTAALAVLEIEIQDWKEMEPGAGRIAELILPNSLSD